MSFSLSTSVFSEFNHILSQEQVNALIDELDIIIPNSLETFNNFVNILFQYFQDDASQAMIDHLIIPSSILSFLNINNTTQTFLCASDPNSVFYNEQISMEETRGFIVYSTVNQGQSITYNYDSANSVTLSHNINGTMTLNGRGAIIGNFIQPVESGDIINIDTHTQIYIGSLLIIVDETKYTKAVQSTNNPGIMPRPINNSDRTHESFGHIRLRLRNAWNTQYKSQLENANLSLAQGLFRTVNNAGDLLSRRNTITNTVGVPLATGQANYVYNSSDYTRFKKEMAHSKNYNDKSSGGTSYKKDVVFKLRIL